MRKLSDHPFLLVETDGEYSVTDGRTGEVVLATTDEAEATDTLNIARQLWVLGFEKPTR